jgi:hypothetical protein
MNNNLLRIKIQQRLNKLASADYDNIECWQIAEAFNKAQTEWFRRQVHGLNLRKESAEQSIALIDDLQKFVVTHELKGTNKGKFFESVVLPDDYAHFIRVSAEAIKDGCQSPRTVTVYLAEEGNVNQLIDDEFKGPSFDWSETFGTMMGDRIRIYTNEKFAVTESNLSYYRKPKKVVFDGCVNPYTGATGYDQPCEFREDVIELMIDEAAAILAGDMESFQQYQRQMQNAQRSN